MAVGRANYNSTATSGATKEVCPANASRTRFEFRSVGDVFILNFGVSATADNVRHVGANESISLTNRDAYDIRQAINVFCANASKFEAQAEEMAVNP